MVRARACVGAASTCNRWFLIPSISLSLSLFPFTILYNSRIPALTHIYVRANGTPERNSVSLLAEYKRGEKNQSRASLFQLDSHEAKPFRPS